MTTMSPEKFIIFDYSGTLSLEAPRFGRSENLVRVLEESGLAALGVSTPEVFWGEIVNPTWIEGSTTAIGYTRVMADRIAALRLAPDAPKSEIEAATSRFVAMYLACFTDRSSLAACSRTAWANSPPSSRSSPRITMRKQRGKSSDYLNSWGIPARKAGTDAPPPFSPASNFFVANSADLGVWKADRRFWEILKSRLPLAAVRRILLIDDFGFNEEVGGQLWRAGQSPGQAGEDHCQYWGDLSGCGGGRPFLSVPRGRRV